MKGHMTIVKAMQLKIHTEFTPFKKKIYSFVFREGEGGIKRGRETSMGGFLLLAP